MIKSFRHKGLEALYTTGSKAGVRPDHVNKLKRQLARLSDAHSPEDMNVPGWRLHALGPPLGGHHAIDVNANWRLTFMFEGNDAILVDYQDYH
jgi:toxin HigB-1